MLLQPFLGALMVYRRLAWPLLPALAAVVLVFLVREPLIVVARQKWTWRVLRPETAAARRRLLVEFALLAASGVALSFAWPWPVLGILAGSAGLLTALAVDRNVRGRRRAIWFQAVSAAGLGSSGLAACLSVEGHIPGWAWWFWGLHAAHYLAAILVVHAGLDSRVAARTAARKSGSQPFPVAATWIAVLFVVAGVGLASAGRPFYGAALLLSGLFHLGTLRGLTTGRSLDLPLRKVGLRAMALSIAITILLVAGSIPEGPTAV
jgi:hypothetical protein